MSQFVLFNWEDDDLTASLIAAMRATFPPGLYAGYDVIDFANPGGMVLRLSMVNGTSITLTDNTTQENRGMLIMPQGVNIQENDVLDIPINPNTSGNPRIDTIYCEHEYVFAQGAAQAIYNVEEGVPGASPVAPVLPNPEKQIVLGYLYIPDGTTALTDVGVEYTKADIPAFANDPSIVRTLDIFQYIIGQKQFKITTQKPYTATRSGVNLEITDKSNMYVLANIGTTYLEINNINHVLTAQGYSFRLLTDQKLKITATGNISLPGNVTQMVVEPGEVLYFYDLNDMPGYPATVNYLVIRGGEASRTKINKFFKQQNWNKGTDITLGVEEKIALPGDGNFYPVIVEGPKNIKYIQNNNSESGVAGTAGPFLFLYINTGGGQCLFKHSAGSVPAGYKAIHNASGLDLRVFDGDIVVVVEDSNTYRIVNVWGVNNNLPNFQNYFEMDAADCWSLGPGNSGDGNIIVNGTARSYKVTVPASSNIEDIQVDYGEGDGPQAFPDGTEINIEFESVLGFIWWKASSGTNIRLHSVASDLTTQTMQIFIGGIYKCLKVDGKWRITPSTDMIMFYLNLLMGNTTEIYGASDTLTSVIWQSAVASYETGYADATNVLQYRKKGNWIEIRGEIAHPGGAISIAANTKLCTLQAAAFPKYEKLIAVKGPVGQPTAYLVFKANGEVWTANDDATVSIGVATGPSINDGYSGT